MEKSLKNEIVESFSIRDTRICKGIAILFMILHHCVGAFYNSFEPSWYFDNAANTLELVILFLSSAGKVCVSLLTILSGYGLAKSYESISNNEKDASMLYRFSLGHCFKLLSMYWVFFAFMCVPLVRSFDIFWTRYSCFGLRAFMPIEFLFDFLGLARAIGCKYSTGDWYLTAIMILYLLFPILFKITKVLKIKAVFISAIPWLVAWLLQIEIDNSFVYYTVSFVAGIYYAQSGGVIVDRIRSGKSSKRKNILAVIIVMLMFLLRLVFGLPVDFFFANSIIVLEIIVLSRTKVLGYCLCIIGKYSANIWLFHGFILSHIHFPTIQKYLSAVIVSLVCSFVIERMKTVTQYNYIVKKITKAIIGR